MSSRDLTWDALVAVAERLSERSEDTVQVWAYRRGFLRVTEGLDAGNKWVYGLAQPVRWRWRFSSHWHEVQPVQGAASKVGAFMRSRPDLG